MAGTTSEKDTRGRPEIDRGALRGLLIDSLPEGTIRWGSMVASIEESKRLGEGITANASRGIGVKMDIHLDNGSVERDYDLVIGADGAWSKVRPLITSVQPFFAGLGGADLYISDVEARYPDLYKFVNRGSVFASSDGKGISAQQKGDGSLVVYLSQTRTSREWKNEVSYDIHSPKEMKQGLLADFADWDPIFHKLIQAADENETIYARSLYMLPVDHRWDHRPGVTLLGDAAHLMTPFAGEGVNLAMEDAMRLADAIITSTSSTTKPKSESNSTSNMTESEDNQLQQQQQQQQKHQLDKNIQSFEENMFIRASKTAKHTFANMTDVFFTPGAPRSTIERYITRAVSDELPFPNVAYYVLGAFVYTYFWIWKCIW